MVSDDSGNTLRTAVGVAERPGFPKQSQVYIFEKKKAA